MGADKKPDLAQEVTIRRDTYGIPHIQARTEEAAAFGLGYAQAEDHCLQICRLYLSARGEEAKYFGTGEENDLLMKLYDNQQESARDLSRVPSMFRKLVNAYAGGVNRYIEQHRTQLPAWVQTITGADVLADRRAGSVHQVFSRETIRELEKKYGVPPKPGEPGAPRDTSAGSSFDAGQDESASDLDNEEGSNAFALSGSKTVSGKPILLGNPHLNWNSLYWEAQVTVPGKIDFFGSTLAGIPVLRAGFNQHLGWVTTNNSPDSTDVFALKLDPQNPDHYLFAGKSRPLVRKEITIESKSQDGKTRTVTRVYWESHLGKIIYRTPNKAFAVKSTLINAFRYYEGFYRLSKTKNLNEYLSVMRKNLVPTSNFTYADAEGNILYLWNAQIPRRADDGTDYRLDVPGESAKYVWIKLHKVDELPRLLNPKGGYIQNCNNPPWYTSPRDPIKPKGYPSYLEAERELALRPQIALEMIEGRERFSIEDVKNLKFTTRMLLAERVKPDLLRALRDVRDPSEEIKEGIDAIDTWDNRVAADSKGAVLFQRFWDTYSAAISKPFRIPWDPAKPARTPEGLSNQAAAVQNLVEAVRWTRQRYGSASIAWGDVHRFRFGDIDLPGDGASGSYGLFRVVRFSQDSEGKRVAGQITKDAAPVGFGDAWVIAVEFTKPIRAWSILAYGESSQSESRHSSDQIKLFAGHELRPIWYRDADIRANLEREYHP
jgi:acyl-homoserine-lactone acylase